MFKNKKKERTAKEINAGSMADIAFLLLIFFLVTTTISAEKGLAVKLPPWDEGLTTSYPYNQKNVLTVKVNKYNDLLVEAEPMEVTELRAMTKRFLMNYGKDPNLSEKPTKAIVSIQNDRATSYDTYIAVYNEVKAAYNEIWEEKALAKYNVSYEALPKSGRKAIQREVPLVISEAEPVEM
ncbi:MAG: biopolymer transport protein ExbD [Maribacter sp.]|jgi:biopolymer transport protein ExbD